MADDCIFCKIAGGKIPSHKVHEDADTLAFLDINPLATGHTLLIPKKHYVHLEDMPANEAATLMWAVHNVGAKVLSVVGAPASTIAINNGKEAGQEVPHLHVHIVPRKSGDGGSPIHALFTKRPKPGADDLPLLSQKIRSA